MGRIMGGRIINPDCFRVFMILPPMILPTLFSSSRVSRTLLFLDRKVDKSQAESFKP